MGWGNCGVDSTGRKIGYMVRAKCDHLNCGMVIDRGLSYACGGMHGNTEYGCEKYFCGDHLSNVVLSGGDYFKVCDQCAKELLDGGEMVMNDHGEIVANDKTE